MPQTREEALAELNGILDTRAGRLYGSWLALNDAWAVLEGNAQDLSRVEERVNNESSPAMLDIHQQDVVLTDLQRRFHNFLAAVVTFDDQTVGHVQRFYRGQEMAQQFDELKNKIFQTAPVLALVRALRNVALHFALPEIRMNFSVTVAEGSSVNDPGTTTRTTFRLDCKYAALLIRRSRTPSTSEQSKALSLLESLPSDLSLIALTDNVLEAFSEIHHWLREAELQLGEGNLEEFIRRYNEVVDRYNG